MRPPRALILISLRVLRLADRMFVSEAEVARPALCGERGLHRIGRGRASRIGDEPCSRIAPSLSVLMPPRGRSPWPWPKTGAKVRCAFSAMSTIRQRRCDGWLPSSPARMAGCCSATGRADRLWAAAPDLRPRARLCHYRFLADPDAAGRARQNQSLKLAHSKEHTG